MATCPECGEEVDVDELDIEKGDSFSCEACGANLVVATVSPVELELTDDEDDEDDEDDVEDDDLGDDDDVDDDEDAEEEEDVDE